MPLLVVEDLTKKFKSGFMGPEFTAVDRVSFTLGEGEILSMLGESGSGKTTIARMILRLLRPTSGRILYKGRDVWRLRGREVLWYYKEVQGVFQDPYSSFNPVHRVDRILYRVLSNLRGLRGVEAEKLVRSSLRRVGLNPQEVLGKYPHQLSGGQLQRVSIARALLASPRLLVADEPVSMLDASTRIDILNILAELRDEEGMAIILIGHDMSLSYYISDRAIVLYRGSIVEDGDVDKVLGRPLHPYTQDLMESVPRLDRKWSKGRIRIPYTDAAPATGCKYRARCRYAFEKCSRDPVMLDVDGRRVACWLYEGNSQK